MKIEEALAITLKNHRMKLNLSQEELAHRCDLDRTFISLLERGKRRPTLTTVFILSKNLDIKPSIFVKEIEDLLLE